MSISSATRVQCCYSLLTTAGKTLFFTPLRSWPFVQTEGEEMCNRWESSFRVQRGNCSNAPVCRDGELRWDSPINLPDHGIVWLREFLPFKVFEEWHQRKGWNQLYKSTSTIKYSHPGFVDVEISHFPQTHQMQTPFFSHSFTAELKVQLWAKNGPKTFVRWLWS